MRETLTAIYEYPWTFVLLCIGVSAVMAALGEAVGRIRRGE